MLAFGLFAQAPSAGPVADPSPWLQGGVAGAVLLTVLIFCWVLKWVVERLSTATEKLGDKITGAIDKQTDKLQESHVLTTAAMAETRAASLKVADAVELHRREADKRHEEVIRALSHRA
jgi:F0F1-type ATP synthase membrane subunit b/b'